MTRQDVYKEIESTLGLVPIMFRQLSERTLEAEWTLFKRIQLDETAIPNKYRELMGLVVAAATKCRYCTLFHTEMAKLFGATDEEIEEAVHYGKSTSGWSTYLNGLRIDEEVFKAELKQVCDHVLGMRAVALKAEAGIEASLRH